MAKLCIDCKHLTMDGKYTCAHPINKSPVTGELNPVIAADMRSTDHRCGPEGKLFEVNTERFSKPAETP